MNSIFNRRSVRKYLLKSIEPEKTEKLIRAAMQAPSAGNQQPWEFIIVREKECLEKLSEVSQYSGLVKNAPLAIVMLVNKECLKYPDYWEQDLSAAAQNILLEAVEIGLGAVWLGIAPEIDRMEYIKKLFNLPNNVEVFGIIAVGYPEKEGANIFVDRYDVKKVHIVKY